jgi:hypothetical protein
VKWLPSVADQEKWADEHPWLIGSVYGVILGMSLVLGGFSGLRSAGVPAWVIAVLAVGVSFAATLMVVSLRRVARRRHWGERADPDSYPTPQPRRSWSRASDRLLIVMTIGSTVVVAGNAARLVSGSSDTILHVLSVACFAWIATTALLELRRRRTLWVRTWILLTVGTLLTVGVFGLGIWDTTRTQDAYPAACDKLSSDARRVDAALHRWEGAHPAATSVNDPLVPQLASQFQAALAVFDRDNAKCDAGLNRQ